MAWTVGTIENRVAQTVNTHERTNNNGNLTSSTKDNRVAQTVNTREKANNIVAWTVSIENRVAQTVNNHERTTPVEDKASQRKMAQKLH